MRMDRYDEENVDNLKKSRTDKNQELYTDVYLNNAYVDISEINEVVNETNDVETEYKKVTPEVAPYSYKEKNYDINELIEQAINENQDNLKRSIEQTTEIDSIIKTINENQLKRENSDNLLAALLPDSDTTTIIEPLGEAITSTKMYDTSILHKDEMSNDFLEEFEKEENSPVLEKEIEEEEEILEESAEEEDSKSLNVESTKKVLEIDDSFANETKIDKKKLFIIIGIVLVIILVLVILIWKKVIKF
ncbi:MAG: hypothetical protein IJ068_06060 [Bacilli bacterium]|nr:hypothetical protein [Bacilli bacterium]